MQQTPISQLVTLQGSEGPLSQLSRRGQGSPDLAPHRPSDALLHARRVLEGVTGYRLLDDLVWHDETCRWFLRCRLSVNTADGLLPPKTDWCVVIEDRDPGGDVSIYPAAVGGIKATFPHQLHNDPPEDSRPWRTGKICTTTPESVLGRLAQSEEPLGLEDRLVWHVHRALWWIKLAAEGKLAGGGAPYELPGFPSLDSLRFVFSEDQTSHRLLLDGKCRSGIAPLRRLALPSGDTFVVDRFQTDNGNNLRTIAWGTAIRNAEMLPGNTAKWILIDSAPLAGPWQVPVTFDELRRAVKDQGLSFDDLVLPLPTRLRDGLPHLIASRVSYSGGCWRRTGPNPLAGPPSARVGAPSSFWIPRECGRLEGGRPPHNRPQQRDWLDTIRELESRELPRTWPIWEIPVSQWSIVS